MTKKRLNISEILNELAKYHSVGDLEISLGAGLPYTTVNRIRNAETLDPRISTVRLIAKYFDISMDQLTGASPLNLSKK